MNINLIGSVNQLGYGLVTTHILSELTKLGHRVSLFPVNKEMEAHPKHHDTVKQSLINAQFPNFSAPCVRIWHQFDMSLFCGGKKIGWPIFELDEFNPQEIHHLNGLDEIIVCSEWAKEIILKHIDKPVHVVPLGVDREIFKPAGQKDWDTFRFFTAGKWEYRKGHDIVLKAFTEAFSDEDNVELICMCDNPVIPKEDNEDWNRTFKYSKLGNKIKLVARQKTQEQVAHIMNKVDCGLFPARAEGWNLELLEMIACGKHCITTNYSAHTEFCNKDNSFLIQPEEKEVAFDGHFFTKDIGSWMKFTDENLKKMVELMRDIYDGHAELQTKNMEKTAEQFTWENSAKKLVEVL